MDGVQELAEWDGPRLPCVSGCNGPFGSIMA